ncbi:MAG: mechanosensitive ion channel domain-containing protein, partial [Cyanobacteria bacterium P01_G01_bin.38]
ELRNSLGISKYIGLESEADLDNQAMAIVSRSQVLANQDKIILIVTDLDTVLYSQDNSGENSLPGDVDVSDMLSPYELSNLYLEKITRTSKYLYEDLVRPVTFNLGPYFWVRPRLSSNPRPNPYLCPPGSVNNVQPSDGQGPNTRGQITLFCVQSLSTYYNASFRADEISKNIDTFANQVNHFPYIPLFQSVKDLIVQPENEGGEIKIRYGENDDQEIMTVTQKETSSNTSDARMEAANTLLVSIQETVRAYRSVYYRTLIVTLIFSGVSLLSIWRIFKKTRRRRRRVTDYSRLWLIPILAGFSIFGYFLPFVRRFPPVQAFGSTVGAIATYLFSDFPALLSIVAWGAVVFWLLPIVLFEFLPKLFNGVIALLSFRWLGASRRTFLRLIHNQDTSPQNATKGLTVSKQKASISILRFIIFAITCVMASPHLPGAGTVYLAGISGFVALAFSLSASAAIGDIIAGLVLIYFSQLNEGSWIQIGDMRGEIIEQNLVVHRIKTAKNEVVTIPNAKVLNSVVTDYSESSKQGEPLVLHTTITLGYDVPWEDVHRLLKEAAADVDEDLLRKDKRPFVRQLSLDDFYVSYQLNVFTDRIDRISLIYSELHKQIQTKLHSAGIEILSPHFEASWDAQNPMIPTKFLENSLANNGEMPEKEDAERGRRGDAEIVP